MGCIDEMNYEVLLSKVTFKECAKYLSSNYQELYNVQPGYRMFDVFIIGVPPIYVGVDGDNIIFPYTKPCHGTFILRINSPEEIERLKKTASKVKKSGAK
ncbi:MAG: DUF1894 domain-containing protein [ANME-2 cluster archaeon]|nr:DUF1894 domain-containing protein [ANME-2 cluster archaeon]MDF1532676.1 DUF1894 domain-containing protein [ANME-2 cluster archaeon]